MLEVGADEVADGDEVGVNAVACVRVQSAASLMPAPPDTLQAAYLPGLGAAGDCHVRFREQLRGEISLG